jgi:hypothetical protein
VSYLALVRKTFDLPTDPIKLAWFDIGESESRMTLRSADTLHEPGERIELAFDHGNLLLDALRVARRSE